MFAKSSTPLIQNVQADNTKVVRFLTEPEEWFAYQEYWDNEKRRYIPVADGVEPPVRPSQRFLAQCVDRETDQVIALKMPKDLTNRLVMRYDRFNTIMDRDYEIMRTGKGLDTAYDVTPEAPTDFDSTKYTKVNLLEILETAFNSAMGDENALFSKRAESTPTASSDDDVDYVEDDDSVEDAEETFFEDVADETEEVETEDETAENMALEEASGVEYTIFTGGAEELKDFFDDVGTEFESVADFNVECLGDDPFTSEELNDMAVGELKGLCQDYELSIVGADKAKLVKKIIGYQEGFLSDCKTYATANGFYPKS